MNCYPCWCFTSEFWCYLTGSLSGFTSVLLQKSCFPLKKNLTSLLTYTLRWKYFIILTQITDKVHVLWEQPSSSGKSVLSNNRHPSERRSHLYGNRTNSSLLIEWKKTLYSVSWLVTISFVVWPELNLWNLSSVNINPTAGEVLCSHHTGGFPQSWHTVNIFLCRLLPPSASV